MKIIFAGTPTFASIILEGLIKEGLKPSCVLTQPDRGKGRGRKVIISPVKKVAIDSEIEVLQPLTLKDAEIQSRIEIMAPDLLVVAAYGLILPREILCTPKFGCINVHASVLPRGEGLLLSREQFWPAIKPPASLLCRWKRALIQVQFMSPTQLILSQARALVG